MFLLTSCIGTDFTDEIIGEDLSQAIIDESELSLTVNNSYQLNFKFQGIDGSEEKVDWVFISSDENIADVNTEGLIQTKSIGQLWIIGTVNATFSDSVLITVVGDSNEIARVIIKSLSTMVKIDSSIQFTAEVKNLKDEIISNVPLTWNSSNPQIASIDSSGKLLALTIGSTQVTAVSGNISSTAILIEVISESGRSGTFTGLNGYSVNGMTNLSGSTGNAQLQLGSNFVSQSGPGLRVYLAVNGNNVSGGLDLGALMSSSGAQIYDLPVNANPNDYSHVFIYCQPFSVPFGVAELN